MDKKKKNAKLFLVLLIILFAAGFFLRLFPLRVFNNGDETVYLQHAEIFFSGRDNFSELDFRPPFLSIIIFLCYFIWHHVFMAEILVAFIGALGIIFMFLLGKLIYDEKTALIGSCLYAFLPYLVKQSHFILTDVPSLVFFMASIYFLLMGFSKSKSVYFFLSGVLFGISFLTRFSILFLSVVYLPYFIIYKSNFKKFIFLALGSALVSFPYFLWAQLSSGFFLTPLLNYRLVENVFGTRRPSSFHIVNMNEIIPFFILLFFLLGTFFSFKEHKSRLIRNHGLVTLMLWVFVFFIFLSLLPAKEIRYLIPLAVPILLISAKGILEFYKKIYGSKYFVPFLIVIFMLVIYFLYSFRASLFIKQLQLSITQTQGFVLNNSFETIEIAYYIKEHIPQDYVVYTDAKLPVLSYYTNMKILYPPRIDFPGHMKKSYFIHYLKEDWAGDETLLSQSHKFKLIKIFNNARIYEYTPCEVFRNDE